MSHGAGDGANGERKTQHLLQYKEATGIESKGDDDLWRLPTLELRLMARARRFPCDGLKEELVFLVNPFAPVTPWALGRRTRRALVGSPGMSSSGRKTDGRRRQYQCALLDLRTLSSARQVLAQQAAGAADVEVEGSGGRGPVQRLLDWLSEDGALRELRQEVEQGRKEVAWLAAHPAARPRAETEEVWGQSFDRHFATQPSWRQCAALEWRRQRLMDREEHAAVHHEPHLVAAATASAIAALEALLATVPVTA